MNIRQIKVLDIGMSGITCTGTVGYLGDPQNITGEKDGRAYNFWSQFLTLQDNTDTIGVSISSKNKQSLLTRGDKDTVKTVEKCTLQSYEKDGQTQLKLQGFLKQAPQDTRQAPPQAAQASKPVSGNKDRLIVAQVVYKAMAEMFAHNIDISPEEAFDLWLTKNMPVYKRHIDMIMRAGADTLPEINRPDDIDPAYEAAFNEQTEQRDEPPF